MDREFFKQAGSVGGRKSASQLWISTETGFISVAAGVCRHNIKRGFSPDARRRWFPNRQTESELAGFDNLD